ncbi:methyl-accepting chemotaxis protein [Roseobacter sp. EG26]|uniref:methyl-accepting chemotaxis protein n=1 Tax=Roseobacter sp. EG26 TaxID=3412477 RepID=UPI003CE49686
MNVQSQIAVPDAALLDTLPYRDAIDRVATLRARVVRVALTVSLLSGEKTAEERDALGKELAAHARTIRHTLRVVEGVAVFETLPDVLSVWLAAISVNHKTEMKVIARMADLTEKLVEDSATETGIPEKQLLDYIAFGQKEFFEAVSALVEGFWTGIESGRAEQLERAMQSAARLDQSLNRLERIGRYVRAMSINASVEASRAGEAGKGLAIIAQEFKVLAEEVQQLTLSAREDIEKLDAH